MSQNLGTLQSANKLKELGVYVKDFDAMVAEAAAGGMPIQANLLKHVDWQIENLKSKCRASEVWPLYFGGGW